MILFFYLLIAFIFIDLALLKRRDAVTFEAAFSFSPVTQVVYGFFFLAGLCLGLFPRRDPGILFSFLIIFVFAVYLSRRTRFNRRLADLGPDVALVSPKIRLACEVMEIFLKWFLGMMAASLVIKLAARIFPLLDSPLVEVSVFTIFSSFLMVVLIFGVTTRIPGMTFQEVLGLKRNRLPWWKLWFLPLLTGIGLAVLSGLYIVSRPVEPQTPFGQLISSVNSFSGFLVFVSAALIFAPFFEEVIFRGFFFHVVQRLRGTFLAVVIIAGLFALLHVDQYWGDWMAIAMVAFLGLVLTLWRTWTGSTIPGIVAHYAFNLTMTALPIIFVLASNPVYFEYQVRYYQLDNQAKEILLTKSIHEHPQHAASYNDLAWLFAEEDKNLNQALALADKALALDPHNYAYVDTKAEVLFKMGREREAIALEEKLLVQHPNNPLLLKQLEKFRKGFKNQKR